MAQLLGVSASAVCRIIKTAAAAGGANVMISGAFL